MIFEYELLDEKIKIEVENNPFNINPKELFEVAARENKKRFFLFVSKVLGKHLSVNPKKAINVARSLSILYQNEMLNTNQIIQKEDIFSDEYIIKRENERLKACVIGFAETATALGMNAFEMFSKDSQYAHTTREILNMKFFEFLEEHSHAKNHRVYFKENSLLDSKEPLVLVDDEITTGKTVLNIIEQIHKRFPRKEYAILSILDFRDENSLKNFKEVEKKLDIKIRSISLLKLKILSCGICDLENKKQNFLENVNKNQIIEEIDFSKFIDSFEIEGKNYLKESGRFFLDNNTLIQKNLLLENILKDKIFEGEKILVLADQEFMYWPMKIASNIKNAEFKATTRSPIFSIKKSNYPIYIKTEFASPQDNKVKNYFYNLDNYYDHIIFCIERRVKSNSEILNALKKIKTQKISIIYFTI